MFEKVSDTEFKEVRQVEIKYSLEEMKQHRESALAMLASAQAELNKIDAILTEAKKIGVGK